MTRTAHRARGTADGADGKHILPKQTRCDGAGLAAALAVQVIDSETGKAMNDSVRTSSGFYYDLGEDEARSSLNHFDTINECSKPCEFALAWQGVGLCFTVGDHLPIIGIPMGQ